MNDTPPRIQTACFPAWALGAAPKQQEARITNATAPVTEHSGAPSTRQRGRQERIPGQGMVPRSARPEKRTAQTRRTLPACQRCGEGLCQGEAPPWETRRAVRADHGACLEQATPQTAARGCGRELRRGRWHTGSPVVRRSAKFAGLKDGCVLCRPSLIEGCKSGLSRVSSRHHHTTRLPRHR